MTDINKRKKVATDYLVDQMDRDGIAQDELAALTARILNKALKGIQ